MPHEGLHEPAESLTRGTIDLHRAIVSLIEELEAIDWYQQRAEASDDAELRALLIHNEHEEIEHAMMTLEWIRRKSPAFDERIRLYLQKDGPITELEKREKARAAAGSTAGAHADGSLGIAGLRSTLRSTDAHASPKSDADGPGAAGEEG